MSRVGFGLIASIFSAVYWWIVFVSVYADVLFSGDRNPDLPPPSERAALVHTVCTIAIGVLLYWGLTLLWDRLTIGWRGRRTGSFENVSQD